MSNGGLLYSKKFDAFYAEPPGAVIGKFRPDEGSVKDNIYTFVEYYPDTEEKEPVKTCFKKTEDGYMIISRLLLE